MDALKYDEYMINNNIKLTVIDVEEFDSPMIELLDRNFVEICEGTSCSDLDTVKKHVKDLYSQKDLNWRIGATAEFFVHLYIRLSGYKQECLFLNLEENSIKKGFDGFYSKNSKYWLMESKAGHNVTHSEKVSLAMSNLADSVLGKKKRNGKKSNNPWQEAYSHACHCDVGTAVNIRKDIKKLANEFVNNVFHPIEEFNTMPCGTVFLTGIWIPQNHDDIKDSIVKISNKLLGKEIHVICSTHKTIDLFLNYIGIVSGVNHG